MHCVREPVPAVKAFYWDSGQMWSNSRKDWTNKSEGGSYTQVFCVYLLSERLQLCFLVQDPTTAGRLVAIRIRFLAKGTIVVEQNLPEKFIGSVEKEAGVTHSTPSMQRAFRCVYIKANLQQNCLVCVASPCAV